MHEHTGAPPLPHPTLVFSYVSYDFPILSHENDEKSIKLIKTTQHAFEVEPRVKYVFRAAFRVLCSSFNMIIRHCYRYYIMPYRELISRGPHCYNSHKVRANRVWSYCRPWRLVILTLKQPKDLFLGVAASLGCKARRRNPRKPRELISNCAHF